MAALSLLDVPVLSSMHSFKDKCLQKESNSQAKLQIHDKQSSQINRDRFKSPDEIVKPENSIINVKKQGQACVMNILRCHLCRYDVRGEDECAPVEVNVANRGRRHAESLITPTAVHLLESTAIRASLCFYNDPFVKNSIVGGRNTTDH